ncbi:MAG: hypothetical protein PWP52_391 [Bacteroidales bacterium]|nr:hypothetical protein [Bacteroidales bacterium]
MNKLFIYTLKALRKIYAQAFGTKSVKPECEQDPNKASQLIYDALMADKPCMIARFGSTELTCLMNYIGVHQHKKQVLSYIKGNSSPWWWGNSILNQMQQWSGFFPPTIEKIEQFCELMLQDIPQVDILGSWLADEKQFENEMRNASKVHLRLIEPFWAENPWTKSLEGKKVLVVHPFAQTIENQYNKREKLFASKSILPLFELKTIKAVQSIAGEKTAFNDWFEAFEYMKSAINKTEYDICLIGAGAYGFPLAAHVKRMGKKAVHFGGSLQLLFGVKGKRWENPNYGVDVWGIPVGSYSNLMNEYWTSPLENERPNELNKVEGGCYW